MRTARRTGLALGLMVVLAGSAQTIRAEPSAEAEGAQREFEAGLAAFERGDLPVARARFESSAQQFPRPSTLINLALVELRLGLPAEALSAVEELDALLTTGAQQSSRERFAERAVALRREVEEQLRLRRLSQRPSAPAAPSAPPTRPPADAPPTQPSPSRFLPRLIAGTGGVLGLAAVGTGAIWWREVEQNMAACHGEEGATCLELKQISRQRRAAMQTTIALGSVAAVLGIGAAAWLFRLQWHPRKDTVAPGSQHSALLRPIVAPRALGLELRGYF